jgi:hypothetical protein
MKETRNEDFPFFLILTPCFLEYVENNQQNALNSIFLYFYFYDVSYTFRQKKKGFSSIRHTAYVLVTQSHISV